MIPSAFVHDLLSRVDIADVVGRHVELKRGGANLMGLCPFHAEKSPSFSVSPSKQFYYCFGCGASGDAIRFLTEHHGMSFVDAVQDLAQQAGMQVPQEDVSPEERVRRARLSERRVSMTELLHKAADFYRAQLRATPAAVAYLKGRGLSGEIAARFGIGWAPDGWRALAGVFAHYDDPLLEESGLVRSTEGGAEGADDAKGERKRWDWFRSRVIFPIRSVQGDVIGFGGRVLDDSKPKYMNSPETPVFSKGRELYGLFEARAALRDSGCALVVEGYMDVVALAQCGINNVVATLGTACTAEQVQKLFRFTDSVVFSFDGDAAGRRAAGRALEAALPLATDLRSVRFLFLPPEHDPDSFVREHGAEAFRAAVKQAVPLSRQLLQVAADGTDLGSAEGRARMLAQAKPLWSALPDGALKRQLLPELARQAQLGIDDLMALWGKIGSGADRTRSPGAAAPTRAWSRPNTRRAPAALADLALRLLLLHSDWWERLTVDDHQLLHELSGAHGEAVAWLERQITEQGALTWATLAEAAAGQAWHAQALRWVESAAPEDQQHFDDLERVLHRMWIERLGQTAQQLAAAASDGEQLQQLRALRDRIDRHKAALAVAAA